MLLLVASTRISHRTCLRCPPHDPTTLPPPLHPTMQNNLRELLALLAFMADTTIDHIECRIKVGGQPGWGVQCVCAGACDVHMCTMGPPPKAVPPAPHASCRACQTPARRSRARRRAGRRMRSCCRRRRTSGVPARLPPPPSCSLACRPGGLRCVFPLPARLPPPPACSLA